MSKNDIENDDSYDSCEEEYQESIEEIKKNEDKNRILFFRDKKYVNLVNFLSSKVNTLFSSEAMKISIGEFKMRENDKPSEFKMLSFNHFPARIVLSHFFKNSIKPTLNREKSNEHIKELEKVGFTKSIFDLSPLIFAIMDKTTGNDIKEIYPEYIDITKSNNKYDSDKYMIYTLDGQHRLSTIYNNEPKKDNKDYLKDKYFDFKFIILNSVEDYKIIFNVINNSLPQSILDNNYSDKIMFLCDKLNEHFRRIYKSKNGNKEPKYKVIREDEKIINPLPPCIHIEQFKKNDKHFFFCTFLSLGSGHRIQI
jgi:hypothetical protein